MQTLYKYDSKGKIRVWDIEAIEDAYIVTHGIEGGKIQEKITRCKAKNIGRSNETTPQEQAVLEAKAKWKFQMDRDDYHYDISKSGLQLRPMLALDYRKVPKRVDYTRAVAQPKLDGLRLTAGNRYQNDRIHQMMTGEDYCTHELMTRKGDNYPVHHLMDATQLLHEIVNLNCNNTCQALDGEAYIHGLPLQKITSLARKYRKGETEQLKYYMFDLAIPDLTFIERHEIMVESIKTMDDDKFVIVPYHNIDNEEQMLAQHGEYVVSGYEGLMIRHADGKYGFASRSADLFKYKQFFDDEFKIVEVWEDKNGNAMLNVELDNGIICGVTPKRTHEERKKMLDQRDELIGKWITVKYQGLTVDESLQFPVGHDLRECDDNGNPIV